MGMSFAYGAADEAASLRVLHRAVELGVTLRRAHVVHPIAAVQSEYSLWSRDVEAAVLPACRELGIGFVPYSPLGRGFLTGQLTSSAQLGPHDYRHSLPRFQPQAMASNAKLMAELQRLAAARGATASQLALAWLLAQGDSIVPIPGARSLAHLDENVAAVQLKLSDTELAAIGAAFLPASVHGARYPQHELVMLGL